LTRAVQQQYPNVLLKFWRNRKQPRPLHADKQLTRTPSQQIARPRVQSIWKLCGKISTCLAVWHDTGMWQTDSQNCYIIISVH